MYHKTGFKAISLSDEEIPYLIVVDFVIAVLFEEFNLTWLRKSSTATGGRQGLLLYDQFSGTCRDVNMKLTKHLCVIRHFCFHPNS